MVIIFRGTSGSGKSRLATLLMSTDFRFPASARYNTESVAPISTPATEYAKVLWNGFIGKEHTKHLCSSDSFFMVNGEYKYDKKLIGTAQQACLRSFYDVVAKKYGAPEPIILVDNTNTTIAEVAPYAALANAFSHELQIITLLTTPVVSFSRNQHNVPFNTIVQQAYRLNESVGNWPSWYPQQVFPE